MFTATEVDMCIIIVCHRRFGMDKFCHTPFSSHSLEHIPECDTAFGGNILLITNQVLDSRHGAEVTVFVLVITVAHAQQQDSRLRETRFEMSDGCQQPFLVVIVIASAFRCDIQSIFKNNQVVRTLAVKLFQHLLRNATQGKSGTAAQREVIENYSLLSIHRQSIEERRVGTVHCPTYGADAPVNPHFLQTARRGQRIVMAFSFVHTDGKMKGVFIVKEDGSTLTGIKQRSVFVLSTQFHVCATSGNEIMSGNPLLLPIEIDAVRHRMAGPSVKCMPHRRTVTACHGSDGNKTYTTTAELFLKHFA